MANSSLSEAIQRALQLHSEVVSVERDPVLQARLRLGLLDLLDLYLQALLFQQMQVPVAFDLERRQFVVLPQSGLMIELLALARQLKDY